MNIFCIGDVVGQNGLEYLCNTLPSLKKSLGVDVCIVNGENSDACGRGISRNGAEAIFSHGADVITTGNHCFQRTKQETFEEQEYLLCPANFPFLPSQAGRCQLDLGRAQLQVINLSGVAFMEPLDNPFICFDRLYDPSCRFTIVDFHAESTAEKKAFSYYVAQRASAVFGTHTHVPTADGCILPGGCGYITDVGMCGPINSVIGVEPEQAIQKQKCHTPVRFSVAQGECCLNGVLFTLDDSTGRCISVEQILA